MATDEQQELTRTESVPAQPDQPLTAARVSVDAVRPAEQATAQLEPMQAAEPVQTTERLTALRPMERAEPLEPMQATERLTALRPMERGTPLEPLHATDRLTPTEPTHTTEPLTPLRPMERAEPLEPTQATERLTALRPMERGTPLEPLHATDRLTPTEPTHTTEPLTPLRPMERAEPLEPTAQLRDRSDVQPAQAVKRTAQSAAPAGSGDSGAGFDVDPEKYRAAAGPVLAASDQLADLTRGLTAYMSGMNGRAPWGNDDSGEKFANGEKGYLTYSGKVLDGLGNLPAALKYISDGLKVMAESYANTEEGLSTGLTSMEAELPETALFHPDLALRDVAKGRPHQTGRP